MRIFIIFAFSIVIAGCTPTSNLSQREDAPPTTTQISSVQNKPQETVESTNERDQLRKLIEEAYKTEWEKPLESRRWDTTLSLAEQYIKKYYSADNPEKSYLDIESIVIVCLFFKGQYNQMIQFVDSSAAMTKTQTSDLVRAYPLRMKASALHNMGRKEESKKIYKKVIEEYGSAINDVAISKQELERIERTERENNILKSKLESAIAHSEQGVTKKSISGLGEVQFSMSYDEVKKIKPSATAELYGQEGCKYKISLYGCIEWREDFYGYPATVTIQFSSRIKMHQIVIKFDSVKSEGACPKFKGNVLVGLVRSYGIPEYVDNKSTWHLDGGEILYVDTCLDIDYIPLAIVSLKPISGI